MIEEWRDLPDFPRYAISNMGRVMYIPAERVKKISVNQTKVSNVMLVDEDSKQARRGVAKMVATAFLPRDPNREHFDTPIHLDGDVSNCDVRNLAWRPYWFAIKYHAQFDQPLPHNYRGPVVDMETDKVYENVRAAAMALGLLEHEIILSALTNSLVFPSWKRFALVVT